MKVHETTLSELARQDCGKNLHFFTKCLLLLADTVTVEKAKKKIYEKVQEATFEE
jgi:hypothetical protein